MPENAKPSLLIVDDDPLITETLSYALGKDFEVMVSDSRAHAVSLLRQLDEAPQLALVDLGLPPLPHRPEEGFQLISDLLAHSPAMKILVLSGQNDAANARHARTLGAAEFVAKPCDPESLKKVLRVLENGEFQRVGETQQRFSRARVIAATNRDLRQEVRNGNFRADLYHRLSVFTLGVPSLREMDDDRSLLLEHYRKFYAEQAKLPPFALDDAAQKAWRDYHFPGNVRELRNVVIRLTTKHAGQKLSRAELEPEFDLEARGGAESGMPSDPEALIEVAQRHLQRDRSFSLDQMLRAWEQGYIEAAMKLTRGNVSQAAKMLGVNRTTLYSRMESQQKPQ